MSNKKNSKIIIDEQYLQDVEEAFGPSAIDLIKFCNEADLADREEAAVLGED